MRNVRQELILELQLLLAAHIERSQQGLTLDGIAHGVRQLLAIESALDQVILHSLVQGFGREFFVVMTGEHHDGHPGRVLQQTAIGLRSAAVGKV